MVDEPFQKNKIKSRFMGPEVSLSCSKEPSTGPYTLFITVIHVHKSHPLVPIPSSFFIRPFHWSLQRVHKSHPLVPTSYSKEPSTGPYIVLKRAIYWSLYRTQKSHPLVPISYVKEPSTGPYTVRKRAIHWSPHRVHKSHPLVPIQSHTIKVHKLPPSLFNLFTRAKKCITFCVRFSEETVIIFLNNIKRLTLTLHTQ